MGDIKLKRIISLTTLLFASLSVFAFPPFARAADPPEPVVEADPVNERIRSGWQFEIDPIYGWIPGMNGTLGVLGTNTDVDVTPIDILSNLKEFLEVLDGFYMGAGELRYGKLGLQYDIVYFDVGSVNSFDSGVVAGTLDVAFSFAMATLAGNYRVYETPSAYVDVLAGARTTSVDLQVGLILGPFGGASSDGDTWVDPIIGVKGRRDLNEHWYLKGSAMVGGFGASSDYLYDLAGYVGYEWSNGVAAYGGFRAAKIDYQNGAFIWDILMYGPVVGLTIHF